MHGNSTDDVAASWLESYNVNNSVAMCDLVNLVLKCTGCDLQVDHHDIEDPDNATNKLTDLQEEYQSQKITDYPLISRAKGNTFSRDVMESFFESIINTIHASGILYSDVVLIENIQVWVTAMSSSVIRPFRHTATVIALAIASALCQVMKEIVTSTATTTRQKESEEKKKSVNKGRVTSLNQKIAENEEKRQSIEGWIRDAFDTVFVHRYRDVEPKIRADCTEALGTWISTCPDLFFEGSYLRYLGWLLSDHNAQVRTEVIRQLINLYQDSENLGRLRAFTDRFRARMVEVACRDAEAPIRALAVNLLDSIRELGLLVPDDIDAVGRLIFDLEPKVRKAVAPFFAATVEDTFETVVEELGGDEGLEDALGEEVEDDYDSPHKSWLKYKCIAELLDSYDFEDSQDGTPAPGVESIIQWGNVETRYSMAAHVVYEGVEDVREWEMLAGYVLYDISTTSAHKAKNDPFEVFKERCQLSEKHERLLLEVLNVAAQSRLKDAVGTETDKRSKRSKVRVDESREIQERTALHLAQFLPKLLRKFGANPVAASAVLRLGRVLDLDIFQELRQDSVEFNSLLDDINKQFLTHGDRNVLAEASNALLHASTFEDLEEVTGSKLQELWEKTIASLRQNVRVKNPQKKNIANNVHRICKLANISDPTEVFLREPRTTATSKSSSPLKILDLLVDLTQQYAGVEDADADSIVINAPNALLAFFMWTAKSIKEKLETNQPIEEVPSRDETISALIALIEQRQKTDPVRLSAISSLLQIHLLFATFRHAQPTAEDEELSAIIANLVQEVPSQAQDLILSSFIATERVFARKAGKSLEDAPDDELPDELPESDDEDDEGAEEDEDSPQDTQEQVARQQQRTLARLLAEKALCEITGTIALAIVARIFDASGSNKASIRKRLLRNKTKLGPSFREVLKYLDDPKPKRSRAKPKATAAGAGGAEKASEKRSASVSTPAPGKSAEKIRPDEDENEDEEIDEDPIEEVEEGGVEDLRRKELLIELPEDIEEDENGGNGEAEVDKPPVDDDEDEIMGD